MSIPQLTRLEIDGYLLRLEEIGLSIEAMRDELCHGKPFEFVQSAGAGALHNQLDEMARLTWRVIQFVWGMQSIARRSNNSDMYIAGQAVMQDKTPAGTWDERVPSDHEY